MQDMFRIGVVASSHGLRGDIKIFPTTDTLSVFDSLDYVSLFHPSPNSSILGREYKRFGVVRLWNHKNLIVAKLAGIDTIEEAQGLKGFDVVVSREETVPLGDDEYYVVDLVGLRVVTDLGEELGKLTEVIQTGANDVYVVKPVQEGKPILIPAIGKCILDIDMSAEVMTVHLLKGLREGGV